MKNGNQYKIKKKQNREGNNAYKNFTSHLEQGHIPNTTSYVELFMNKIQKSQNLWGNNAYKNFTSWVEQGYIRNAPS